jgi:hypothetical protein
MPDSGAHRDYSGTPLATKLGVKPGYVVLLDDLPDDLVDLGGLCSAAGAHVVRRLRSGLHLTVTFQTRSPRLARRLPDISEHTTRDGSVWVAWPKQAAARRLGIETDLSDGVVRELGLDVGWVDVKVAAISEVWSGLKFVRRVADR